MTAGSTVDFGGGHGPGTPAAVTSWQPPCGASAALLRQAPAPLGGRQNTPSSSTLLPSLARSATMAALPAQRARRQGSRRQQQASTRRWRAAAWPQKTQQAAARPKCAAGCSMRDALHRQAAERCRPWVRSRPRPAAPEMARPTRHVRPTTRPARLRMQLMRCCMGGEGSRHGGVD